MARTAITPQAAGGAVTFGAADATNGMRFVNDGKTVLIVKNASAAAITVTVRSVPCSHGRLGDLIVTVPATTGEAVIGPFAKDLFDQQSTDLGNVYVDFSASASVTVAAVKLS